MKKLLENILMIAVYFGGVVLITIGAFFVITIILNIIYLSLPIFFDPNTSQIIKFSNSILNFFATPFLGQTIGIYVLGIISILIGLFWPLIFDDVSSNTKKRNEQKESVSGALFDAWYDVQVMKQAAKEEIRKEKRK